MTNNWRTSVNASDYFGAAKKNAEIEQRRPSLRRPSDIVGPGIAPQAVKVNDWNNTLATFNGYYCGVAGTANAPDGSLAVGSRETFMGITSMDADQGGVQILTGLNTSRQYRRTFKRNPADSTRLYFAAWTETDPPAEVGTPTELASFSFIGSTVSIPTSTTVSLSFSSGTARRVAGESGVFSTSTTRLTVNTPGIYAGKMGVANGGTSGWSQITSPLAGSLDVSYMGLPEGSQNNAGLGFTLTAADISAGNNYVSVQARNSSTTATRGVQISGCYLVKIA